MKYVAKLVVLLSTVITGSIIFYRALIDAHEMLLRDVSKTWSEEGCKKEMSFPAYNRDTGLEYGRAFPCELKSFLEEHELTDKFSYQGTHFSKDDVVIASYASGNHMNEIRKSIASIRSKMTNKIIIYDLGLSKPQADELRGVCNLELRRFRFEKYYSPIRHLKSYHFKGIILAEIFREFPAFWFLDASIRFKDGSADAQEQFYARVQNGSIESFVMRTPCSHSTFAATNPQMYSYLPISPALARSRMLESGTIFVWRNDFSRQVIKWNALCALTPACIAPRSARIQCYYNLEKQFEDYVYCHRFDQSALNIITSSLMERDGWKRRDAIGDNVLAFTHAKRGDDLYAPLELECAT